MASRKITIVVLPEGTRKIKQLKIPKSLLYFFFLLFLSAVCFLVWVFLDYQDIKTQIPPFTSGWNLNSCAEGTLEGLKKTNDGAMAPLLWQDGKYAELATYVIQDVKIEHKLFLKILETGTVTNQDNQTLTLPGIKKWQGEGSHDKA